jgi:Protein of unknown function (DUF3445)
VRFFQYLPESEPACQEALEVVLDFLIGAWPNVIERFRANNNFVRNNKTREEFNLDEIHPLEVAGTLAVEDFNVLEETDKGYSL